MSSNQRTNINLSLTVLAKRGENPNLHGDGWGVAFYEGKDVRLIKDSGQAKESKWVDFIKQQEIRSHDIIAHIRKSTVGEVSYSNTHPFARELKGRMHTFAHNGTFKDIQSKNSFRTKHYRPVGSTDSEHAFCVLMEKLALLWADYDGLPPLQERFQVVSSFAEEMRNLGAANFLYSDGETLFGHGHQRHDPITDVLQWPGLHYINFDCEDELNGFEKSSKSAIALKDHAHVITLFASVPLSKGDWHPMKEGEVIAVTKGVCSWLAKSVASA
ncbi:MAG TPA: class II glutamine amidotransferase [Bacteriovoracaceae bacterium]|nr:class II glutamine amidotransferase [Bacteriovoracaceae bacterium]